MMGYLSRVLKRLKVRFVNWLLRDVAVQELRVIDLKVGEHTVKIYTDHIDVNGKMQIYDSYIDGKGAVIKNINGLQLPVGTDKYLT